MFSANDKFQSAGIRVAKFDNLNDRLKKETLEWELGGLVLIVVLRE